MPLSAAAAETLLPGPSDPGPLPLPLPGPLSPGPLPFPGPSPPPPGPFPFPLPGSAYAGEMAVANPMVATAPVVSPNARIVAVAVLLSRWFMKSCLRGVSSPTTQRLSVCCPNRASLRRSEDPLGYLFTSSLALEILQPHLVHAFIRPS